MHDYREKHDKNKFSLPKKIKQQVDSCGGWAWHQHLTIISASRTMSFNVKYVPLSQHISNK